MRQNNRVRKCRYANVLISILATLAAWGGSVVPSSAAPVAFGANSYDVVIADGIDWNSANAAAMSMMFNGVAGHLATITSLGEDQFLQDLADNHPNAANSGIDDSALWIGGSQLPGSLPKDGWSWVNGEGPIAGTNAGPGYANWLSGEPNDFGQPESHLAIHFLGNFGWNDAAGDTAGNAAIAGYVVEYESTAPVPVPSAMLLMGTGLLGLIGWNYRIAKKE